MRYTSRKFILSCLTLAASTWLVFEHVLASGDYKAILIGTIGLYIAGNVAQKATVKDGPAS